MTDINIVKVNQNTYQVTVIDNNTTTHDVHVEKTYALQLTQGKISTTELIIKSFEFLLEREPNTSILRQFDLPLINRYFPEYEQHMAQHL